MIQQLVSSADRVIVTADLPHVTPEALFDFWIQPEYIAQWWGPQASIDATVDGSYHLEWAQQGWHLRGTYKAVERGKILIFTWHWDHEPGVAPTEVSVVFHPSANGAALTLTHGVYPATEAGKAECQSHLDGWMHFLSVMQKLNHG